MEDRPSATDCSGNSVCIRRHNPRFGPTLTCAAVVVPVSIFVLILQQCLHQDQRRGHPHCCGGGSVCRLLRVASLTWHQGSAAPPTCPSCLNESSNRTSSLSSHVDSERKFFRAMSRVFAASEGELLCLEVLPATHYRDAGHCARSRIPGKCDAEGRLVAELGRA